MNTPGRQVEPDAAIVPDRAAQPQPISDHGLHAVFTNAGGLRAGWSVLLFVATFLLTDLLLSWLLHPLLLAVRHTSGAGNQGAMPLGFACLVEGMQLVGAFSATLLMARLEQQPLAAYGYQGSHRLLRFVAGIACGFAAISALVLVLWKTGLLSLDGRLLHGSAIWTHAAGWAGFFLIVAFFEESLLRGYLQFTLTRGLGFWWGAILLSFVFGFSHGTNRGESPVGLLSAGAIGLVFCLSLWYTGSLWWAVGFHAAWDWGESYFYGTSDSGMLVQGHLFAEHPLGRAVLSGGATGPEGSLLVLPLVVLMALVMTGYWHRSGKSIFRQGAWRPLDARPQIGDRMHQRGSGGFDQRQIF